MFDKIRRIVIVSLLYYGWHIPFDSTLALAQTDQVQARFVGSGVDAGSFPITTGVTRVNLTLRGVQVEFDKRQGPNRWPNTCGNPLVDPADDCKESPSIDMGALQYSLGLAVRVNGEWVASAPVETWFGNDTVGGQIQDQTVTCTSGTGQIHCNWFYDGRWAPLDQVRPAIGEQVGIFVVAGDARNQFYRVKERSNIVLVTLPASNTEATFAFQNTGHPDRSSVVAQAKADLLAAHKDIAGPCGAFSIVALAAQRMKAEGAGLLSKPSGNNCQGFATDIIAYPDGQIYDVLVAAGGTTGQPGDLTGNGPAWQDDGNAGADRYRAPIAVPDPPGDVTPTTCQDPKANNVGKPLPCTYDSGVPGPPGPKGDKGDPGPQGPPGPGADQAVVQALQDRITALENALKAIKVPTGCKASLNLGATRIGIHCELTY